MKVIKWLFIIVVALVALFVGVGLILGTDYELSRSVVINAPADKIHPLVENLEKWDSWTPWKDGDPNLKVTIGEQKSGAGARQTWDGDSGKGELELTRSDPMAGVDYKMAFIIDENTKAESVGSFKYEKAESGTKVTWYMKGSMPMPVLGGYLAKMMDSFTGPKFEIGLNRLKVAAEK